MGLDRNYEFKGHWQEASGVGCGSGVHDLPPGSSAYFNIADAILTARMYVDARRDDSDGICRVDVQYPDSDWSNYNNIWNEITLFKNQSEDHGLHDGTVIHEYGHC